MEETSDDSKGVGYEVRRTGWVLRIKTRTRGHSGQGLVRRGEKRVIVEVEMSRVGVSRRVGSPKIKVTGICKWEVVFLHIH